MVNSNRWSSDVLSMSEHMNDTHVQAGETPLTVYVKLSEQRVKRVRLGGIVSVKSPRPNKA